ncbi:hypothetical protein VCRA2113O325_10287 [Vibrio crassostreae]|nr:hypothetical protein VCRA2113O322_10625 [Vibrio crassostreae]CAK1912190.1 hypothetical protein VCRA2113O326_10625 [Vibrio crassostreae]CAK2652553.1 hypothetical protein VCRA2113O323_10285 [Vibrio crassostreae]CAK2707481.1 hypothetical protein VCRA2113O321_10624 [Vibrio crassostreae]CAK2714518.1 hypothetical protein VCRA2113O325_10287 [Vibrio crassostreae]
MDSCDTDLPICDTSPILQSVMIHMVNKFMISITIDHVII